MPNPNHLTFYHSDFTEVDGLLTLNDRAFNGINPKEVSKVNFVFIENNSALKAFCKSLKQFPNCKDFSFDIGYYFRREDHRFKASDYREFFEEFAITLDAHPGLKISISFLQDGYDGGTPKDKKEYLEFAKELQGLVVQHAQLSKISVFLKDVVKGVNEDEFTNIFTGFVLPCESLALFSSSKNQMRDFLKMSKDNLGNLKSFEVSISGSPRYNTFEYLGAILPPNANITFHSMHHEGVLLTDSKETLTVTDLMLKIGSLAGRPPANESEIMPAESLSANPQPSTNVQPSEAKKSTSKDKDCCVLS